MLIRTLIVDDEPYSRLKLRGFLEGEADIEIVGEAGDGRSAVQAIRKLGPDLVFLDVQMPGYDGFQVLEAVGRELPTCVIFATAYDQYALRAFEVHALDYLLKPFDQERFQAALDRARQCLGQTGNDEGHRDRLLGLVQDLSKASAYPRRLFADKKGRMIAVAVDEVEWIEAAGNYSILHVRNEEHLLPEGLGNVAKKLDPRQFFRANRSSIVNLGFVREIQPSFHGEFIVIMKSDRRMTVTRTRRAEFLKVLGRA